MHLSSSSSTLRSGLEPSPMKCRLSSSGSTGLLGAGRCPSESGGAKLPEPPAGDWPSLQVSQHPAGFIKGASACFHAGAIGCTCNQMSSNRLARSLQFNTGVGVDRASERGSWNMLCLIGQDCARHLNIQFNVHRL